MTKVQTLVFILLKISLQIFPVCMNCILLTDCPAAREYLEFKPNDPATIKMFRDFHCGSWREAKIVCERIPDIDPKGCVPLSDCAQALDLIRSRGRHDLQLRQLLLSLTCGFSRRRDKLFCDKIKNDKRDLLPKMEECGVLGTSSRITGGTKAELDEYVWTALLRYKTGKGGFIYKCHGSVISQKYVITAAHCLIHNLYSVVLGEYDIESSLDCVSDHCAEPIQELYIESVHVHPQFNQVPGRNDIALIRLQGTAKFTDYVQPICLPLTGLALERGRSLLVTGWGKTKNETMSKIKLKATIRHLDKEECLGIIPNQPLHESQICAGSDNGADTCKGDSGGPLMVAVKMNGEFKFFLTGVVSLGHRCGDRSAVYTNVSLFADWILQTIQP